MQAMGYGRKSPFLSATATPIWPHIFFSSCTVNFFASFHADGRVTGGDVSRRARWDWPAADGICSSLLAIRAPAGTIQDVQAPLRQATSGSRRRLRQQRPPQQQINQLTNGGRRTNQIMTVWKARLSQAQFARRNQHLKMTSLHCSTASFQRSKTLTAAARLSRLSSRRHFSLAPHGARSGSELVHPAVFPGPDTQLS